MSMGRQAAQSAIWNYAAFLVSKGFVFAATLILARLLSPADFGLVGMALLVISVLDIVRDFGIGAALIYQQKNIPAAANMSFMMNVVIGVSLFTLNWFFAPVTVQFFKTSGPSETALVISIIQVLGLSILFSSLGSTHDALLQKNLNFSRRMVPEVGRTLVKGVLSVVLAVFGWGVWSLVIGQVTGEATATLALWIVSKWRLSLRTDRSLFRPLLGYGVQIMGVNFLGLLVNDVDYFIIGRVLGGEALGLYTLAFRIPELLIRNMALAVSNVAFPVAAKLQSDIAALRSAYLRMQHYMLIILAPLGFGLAAVTPALVHLLFKPDWYSIIPVMQVLSLYMVLGGISHWPGVVYKAVGRPGILNMLSFVKVLVLAPVLWWCATNYGILGVAWGQIGVRSLTLLLDMYVVSRFVDISMLSNLRIIFPPLLASAVMALVVRALFLVDPTETSIPLLVLAVLTGAAIYACLEWVLDREAVSGLFELARSALRRQRAVVPAEDVQVAG